MIMPANKNWLVYKVPLMAKYPGIFSAANWLLGPLILKKHIQRYFFTINTVIISKKDHLFEEKIAVFKIHLIS